MVKKTAYSSFGMGRNLINSSPIFPVQNLSIILSFCTEIKTLSIQIKKYLYDVPTYIKGTRLIQIGTSSKCFVESVDHGIPLIFQELAAIEG